MIPLIRVGEPPVVALIPEPRAAVSTPARRPSTTDPEEAYRLARSQGWAEDLAAIWAASAAGLPTVDENGDSIAWTMRDVRRHVFGRWLAQHGAAEGDDGAYS